MSRLLQERQDRLPKDCYAVFGQHNVLGGIVESLLAQPSGKSLGPCRTTGEDPTMAQQKGLQVLASTPQILHCSFAGAHEFSDRFVAGIGYPDCS